uniref:ABC transporter domain-containing protein n=1 Tax=Timema bartmani TaxID=61472 RepID=A0A7R9F402_9NEOP|nr:unnamed protein product [Timema bartmani]
MRAPMQLMKVYFKGSILPPISYRTHVDHWTTPHLPPVENHSKFVAGVSSVYQIYQVLSEGGGGWRVDPKRENGQPRNIRRFHKMSCYITQEDQIQPLLTVEEAMMVSANLKLPTHLSKMTKMNMIMDILATLNLSETLKSRTEALSGGQKKLLSIALELINNPPVFFLDEPTSGLDIVSAKQCLNVLHTLSRQGRTIVCTIHQPSASLFQLFDHVYVVSAGLCVYQGTTGGLVSFLSSVGLSCPVHYNPADYIIELSGGGNEYVKILSTAIANGQLCWEQTQSEIVRECAVDTTESFKSIPSSSNEQYSQHVTTSFTVYPGHLGLPDTIPDIDSRIVRAKLGSMLSIQLQLLNHAVTGLLTGLIFFQAASDGTQMYTHMKLCIGIILFHSYTWCMTAVLLFPGEVKLLKKEYFNRWHGLTSYYMALTISRLPIQIVASLIFLTLVYFLTGMPFQVLRFSLFSLVGILVSFVADGLGMSIGSVFSQILKQYNSKNLVNPVTPILTSTIETPVIPPENRGNLPMKLQLLAKIVRI